MVHRALPARSKTASGPSLTTPQPLLNGYTGCSETADPATAPAPHTITGDCDPSLSEGGIIGWIMGMVGQSSEHIAAFFGAAIARERKDAG